MLLLPLPLPRLLIKERSVLPLSPVVLAQMIRRMVRIRIEPSRPLIEPRRRGVGRVRVQRVVGRWEEVGESWIDASVRGGGGRLVVLGC